MSIQKIWYPIPAKGSLNCTQHKFQILLYFHLSVVLLSTPHLQFCSLIGPSNAPCSRNSHCIQGSCPGNEIMPSPPGKPIHYAWYSLSQSFLWGVGLSHRPPVWSSNQGEKPGPGEIWGKPTKGLLGRFFLSKKIPFTVNIYSKRTKSLFALFRDASQGDKQVLKN